MIIFWYHLPAHVGHEKKSENILMCVSCPSTPPWTRPRYKYVLSSNAEGTLFRFKNEHKKLKQNAITSMNNNNESKIFIYKDPFDVVVVFVLERLTKLRSY